MKAAAKISSLVIGIILIIFVIAGFVLVKVINPNDFKRQIAEQVYKKTGRQLTINGDISLSYFPWLGLKINNMQLGNPANFSTTTHFASIEEVDVTIKVLALLTGKVEVGKVVLNQPIINLIKNADGSNNWKDLLASNKTTTTNEEKPSTEKTDKEKFSIKEIAINDGQINFQDKQKNQQLSVKHIDFDSSNMAFNEAFPIKLSGTLASSTSPVKLMTELSTKIKYLQTKQLLTADDLKITLTLSNKNTNPLKTVITGNVSTDFANSILSIDTLRANGDAIHFNSARIQAKNDFKNVSGDFNLTQFNVKKLLAVLAKPMATSDPRVLQSLSAKGTFSIVNNKFNTNSTHFQLDDSKGQADVNYDLGAQPKLGFNVNLDQINLDRYMSNSDTSKSTTDASSAKADSNMDKKADAQHTTHNANSLAIDGRFTIYSLHIANKELKNVTGHLIVQNNTTKLAPLTANVFGGSLNSTISITQTAHPIINIAAKLNNAQLGEITGSSRLSGLTNLNTQLSMQGSTKFQLLSSLNGPLSFDIKNAAIEGVDLDYQLDRVSSFLKKEADPAKKNANKTVFATVTGSGQFQNGVFNNNQLKMTSVPGNISGSGTANLVNERINYRLLIKPSQPIKFSSDTLAIKFRSTEIPIVVTGTFNDPSVSPDFAALTKSLLQLGIQKGANTIIEGTTGTITNGIKEPAKLLNQIFGN